MKLMIMLGLNGRRKLIKTNVKPKTLYMDLRFILTGRKFGPSMNNLLTLFKREEILRRIELIVSKPIIKLYDSTLRDGAQTKGVNFSLMINLRFIKYFLI